MPVKPEDHSYVAMARRFAIRFQAPARFAARNVESWGTEWASCDLTAIIQQTRNTLTHFDILPGNVNPDRSWRDGLNSVAFWMTTNERRWLRSTLQAPAFDIWLSCLT